MCRERAVEKPGLDGVSPYRKGMFSLRGDDYQGDEPLIGLKTGSQGKSPFIPEGSALIGTTLIRSCKG